MGTLQEENPTAEVGTLQEENPTAEVGTLPNRDCGLHSLYFQDIGDTHERKTKFL